MSPVRAAVVPVTVAARNEERALGACLRSLLASIDHAERALPGLAFDVRVVLDECTDGTERVARAFAPRVHTVASRGGKVEAQRAGVRPGAFQLFADADILVDTPAVAALARVMLERPGVQVAFPDKAPLAPARRTPLALALHAYNRARGYQTTAPTWFSGKLFAIRRWHVPTREELAPRVAALPRDRFYAFHRGMRVDDIYLSRAVLREHGPAALARVPEARIWFGAPETLAGMYRYYKRMRMELERMDLLFPETRAVHARFGSRAVDAAAVRRAGARERALLAVFDAALAGCRAAYRAERFYYRRLARDGECEPWVPIRETKRGAESVP